MHDDEIREIDNDDFVSDGDATEDEEEDDGFDGDCDVETINKDLFNIEIEDADIENQEWDN
ncbi:UNVERIFIED_CONTAM: hypothetical protein ITH36_25475 [Salmonella enterica subsp. enterica serovar Weltevreden]